MINKTLLKAEAEKIGVFLDETALKRLDMYAEMLVETNKTLNLTAITDADEIVYKHFIDSLTLLKCVDFKENAKVIDVGTGAGFPGVVLLIARPDLIMTLLDGTNKRLLFISNVLNALDLKANVVHMRAELAGKDESFREQFDVVTARAVANLNTLSEYCMPFVKIGGYFAPMKILGGKIKEIKELNIDNCGERYVILTKKISQTPSKYPRASAQILKKPLS